MANSRVVEVAERISQQMTKELQDVDLEAASKAFKELLDILRELGKQNDELKAAAGKNDTEKQRLLSHLADQCRRLRKILEHFPVGILQWFAKLSDDDVFENLSAVSAGVTNLLLRLREIETEQKLLKKRAAEARESVRNERDQLEKLKALISQAESMMKTILGDAKSTGTLIDMVAKMQQLVENERSNKANVQKQLELCLKIVTELKAEFEDVNKILVQLFEKCNEIDRSAAELGVKIGTPPMYNREAEDSEQFIVAVSWLVQTIAKLLDEYGKTQYRMKNVEQERNQLESLGQQKADEMKRITSKLNETMDKVHDAERQVLEKKLANDAIQRNIEERRSYLDHCLAQMKQHRADEQKRLANTAKRLDSTLIELNSTLTRMKRELDTDQNGRNVLAKCIDDTLNPLRDLQKQYNDDTRTQQDIQERLGAEEKQLIDRLKDAQRSLKQAELQRDALAEAFRKVKRQSGNVTTSIRQLEEEVIVYKEEHLKAQETIARMKADNDRLADQANKNDQKLRKRDQAIKELNEKQAKAKDAIKQLENMNNRLRSGVPSEQCAKCQSMENSKENIVAEIGELHKQKEELLRRLDKEKKEMKEAEERLNSSQLRRSTPRSRRSSIPRPTSRIRSTNQERKQASESRRGHEGKKKREMETKSITSRDAGVASPEGMSEHGEVDVDVEVIMSADVEISM